MSSFQMTVWHYQQLAIGYRLLGDSADPLEHGGRAGRSKLSQAVVDRWYAEERNLYRPQFVVKGFSLEGE